MVRRVLVLGAGFGGLELSTLLSEALGDDVEVTLIDKSDAFIFGYSKLDVMFGRKTLDSVKLPYRELAKPGVRFLQETVTAIDPDARSVTTDARRPRGRRARDRARSRLRPRCDARARRGRERVLLRRRSRAAAEMHPGVLSGRVVVGVCGAPFKCPPAPSECALLLHDYFTARGVRGACEISFVIPFGTPGPAVARYLGGARRGLRRARNRVHPGRRVSSLDNARNVAVLDDGSELPFDLFLGVPKHRAPDVVIASGMTETATSRPTRERSPTRSRASTRSATSRRSACRRRASSPRARRGRSRRADRAGRAAGRPGLRRDAAPATSSSAPDGRPVDVDFFSGPKPTGTYQAPSAALVAEKQQFGSSRRARWFDT